MNGSDGKPVLRERIWDHLEGEGLARFPFPPHGRIPNYDGASAAADRLATTAVWSDAATLKANPDAPQLPVRRRALAEGKTLYMAAPRLRDERPFLELDPARIPPDEYDRAPTVSHAEQYARPVGPDELPHVDLVVSGSVAVTEAGVRVGKGEGYADLEFAVLSELGVVDETTTVVTTVHDSQVVDETPAPEAHDVPLDLVVTPTRAVETDVDRSARPDVVDWDLLSEERIGEMPVLERLRATRRG